MQYLIIGRFDSLENGQNYLNLKNVLKIEEIAKIGEFEKLKNI